jgi:hypothetical protein
LRLLKLAGVPIEEYQRPLQHASVATTQLYGRQMESGTNQYAGKMADQLVGSTSCKAGLRKESNMLDPIPISVAQLSR